MVSIVVVVVEVVAAAFFAIVVVSVFKSIERQCQVREQPIGNLKTQFFQIQMTSLIIELTTTSSSTWRFEIYSDESKWK